MKLTMEQYAKVAASVLSIPRRNRDMLERALVEKRVQEDEEKFEKDVKMASVQS